MLFKTCRVCKQTLPSTTEYFYKRKTSKDGLRSECIECNGKSAKNRYEMKKIYWQSHDPYDANETKTCTECGKTYPKTKEYWLVGYINNDGLETQCKQCRKHYHIKYSRNNAEKIRKTSKDYYNSKRGKKNLRIWNLKTKYNISLEEYNQIFESQDGKCAICGRHQSGYDRYFCVDHEHKTGEIRGLLCDKCNRGIGFFDDNIDLLIKTIEYLEK